MTRKFSEQIYAHIFKLITTCLFGALTSSPRLSFSCSTVFETPTSGSVTLGGGGCRRHATSVDFVRVYSRCYATTTVIKQRPFPDNDPVNTFPLQRTRTQQYKNGVLYVACAETL
jgi:hypothetical protein